MTNAVLFTVTGSYVQLTGTAIASLCDHLPLQTELKVLVMADEILPADIYWLKEIPERFGHLRVSVDVWQKPPIMAQVHPAYQSERYPPVTLWRLFAPFIFPQYNRLLYMDNDVLIQDDILPMFSLLRPNSIVGAVNDFQSFIYAGQPEGSIWAEVKHFDRYFNDGVLLIDPAQYIEAFTQEQLVAAANTSPYLFLDQTILNNLVGKRITYLPMQYNYQMDDAWLTTFAQPRNPKHAEKIQEARQHVVIRHFISTQALASPWQHGVVKDEFERAFWQTFARVKLQ